MSNDPEKERKRENPQFGSEPIQWQKRESNDEQIGESRDVETDRPSSPDSSH
jgi:hypothetical protein